MPFVQHNYKEGNFSMTKEKEDRGQPTLGDLQHLIRRLRGPDGCPWDREQGLQDIKRYLLEECYELMEAIDQTSTPKLQEELGDLLFQVLFITEISLETGEFGLEDVLEGIHTKMVRRHPHVFGNVLAEDTETVKQNWWKIKRTEGKGSQSLLESVPGSLPALQRTYRLSQRASQVGLDWPDPVAVLGKVKEEIVEFEQALENGDRDQVCEELGDVFFSLANLSRHLGRNPEELLQQTNQKFMKRFQLMEQRAVEHGLDLENLTPAELDNWWEEAKRTR